MFPQFAQEGSFNQDHSIVHVASKVYLSQVDLTTTYCPGSKTKVAMVTPADHTGQHLIKTTQNDFAPPQSKLHTAIHPCQEPHSKSDGLNTVSR